MAKEEREDILSEVRDKLGVVAIVSKIVSSCSLQSLVLLRSTSLNFTKPRAKISLSTMLRSSSARLGYCKKVWLHCPMVVYSLSRWEGGSQTLSRFAMTT